jgi:hypothetical protein
VPPVPSPPRLPLQPADLQGLSRLAVDATVGVVDLVERLHHTIVQRSGIVGAAPTGRTTGVTGLVYRSVRGTTQLTGRGLDALLGAAVRRLPTGDSPPAREAALAALNGLWGDHLESSGNPLALSARIATTASRWTCSAPRWPRASRRRAGGCWCWCTACA